MPNSTNDQMRDVLDAIHEVIDERNQDISTPGTFMREFDLKIELLRNGEVLVNGELAGKNLTTRQAAEKIVERIFKLTRN